VKEMKSFFNKGSVSTKTRVLSDFYSGRTDRVVHEAEVDSWADYQRIEGVINADPAVFKAWFARLSGLIDGTEVEAWQVH
jgi:hypothetical protein